ncbi:MAG: argininosuccinate lyase [SAR324 cluster bacterium]|nr:argininosuccinate lyase [SAR324 cluster bacterium]
MKKDQVWGNHLSRQPAEQNVLFCAGRDVQSLPMADEILLPFDIWTNRAHSIMLFKQGIISADVLKKILSGLADLEQLVNSGQFQLDPLKEDVHFNVESFVTTKFGAEAGGSMHTGRSRNDQAACDTRLYLRNAGMILAENILILIESLLEQAEKFQNTVMPGFTHYQPAMITTWGHWLCSYAQALQRDVERVLFGLKLVNRNPLGAAASFGTSWPIDRDETTRLLGFDSTDLNTLDCIVARWENEAQLAQTYGFFMNHCSIIAQDLIFLSLPYIKMIRIDDAFVTGSSIMPQKKNPDFAEVLKSKASLVQGALSSLMGIQKGGLSGYNRDTQLTKYLIMDVVRECEAAPVILKGVFETLHIHARQMKQHCQTGFMNAVDLADYLATRHHLPFRSCYNIAALAVKYSESAGILTYEALQQALKETGTPVSLTQEDIQMLNNPQEILKLRQHQGAPSPESVKVQIDQMLLKNKEFLNEVQSLRQRIRDASESCIGFKVG